MTDQQTLTNGTTRDTRMGARALIERWPLTPETRQKVINAMQSIVTNPLATRREKTAASRALIAADKLNLDENAIAKLPDQSEAAIDARYQRSIGILDRLRAITVVAGGTVGDPIGCVDGSVRSGSASGPLVDASLPHGGVD